MSEVLLLASILAKIVAAREESRNGSASSKEEAAAAAPEDYMQHMTSALVLLHLAVFVSGLVGNLLVCLSVFRNKSLQTVTNYYIVNLAVADFLVILICLPPTLYWDLTLTWSFGLALCKLVPYLQSVSVSVSVLTLTCISLDRCWAICRPLEFCSTKRRAKRTIALVWLSSALFASPDLIYLTTKRLGGGGAGEPAYVDCAHSWPEQSTRIYQLCISALLFLLPLLLMSLSYWHIVRVLWRPDRSLCCLSEEPSGAARDAPSGEINCHLAAQSIPANDQSPAAAAEMRPPVMVDKNLHRHQQQQQQQQWAQMGSTNQSSQIETTSTIGAAANGPLYGLATESAGPFDAAVAARSAPGGAPHGRGRPEAGPANDPDPFHGGADPQPGDNKGDNLDEARRWWPARRDRAAAAAAAKSCRRYRKNLANYAGDTRASSGSKTRPSTPDGSQAAAAAYNGSANKARFCRLIESRKKAAKMLIVIVVMFALCYLPVHFLNVLRYTVGLPQNDLTQIASLVSHWLCYFNSAVNPLIYNLMSGKFRHEFANLFFCRCFRRRGQQEQH